jgi:hypothetical protein
MGVPNSEVGYTSATTGRGVHEVHKGHVVVLGGGNKKLKNRINCKKQGEISPVHAMKENKGREGTDPILLTAVVNVDE